MKFQNAYSDSVRASDLECKDPSLAQQQFKDEVDINKLLERFKVTGQMPRGIRLPTYGDFSGVNDYRTAMNSLLTAQDAFNALPANVRSRFANDPQNFLEFCSDPKNESELISLGLLEKAESPSAKPVVPAVAPAPAPAPDISPSK